LKALGSIEVIQLLEMFKEVRCESQRKDPEAREVIQLLERSKSVKLESQKKLSFSREVIAFV